MTKPQVNTGGMTPDAAQPASRNDLAAFGVNGGLAMFASALIWEFAFGFPETASAERIWAVLFFGGIGLAATTWIACSSSPRWLKPIVICVAIVALLIQAVATSQDFDADNQLLKPGRIERGRFVHDRLGLSFRVPGLRPLLDVQVTSRNARPHSTHRLRYGEEATILRLALPNDPEGRSSPIRVSVKPFRFSRIDVVVQQVLNSQTSFAAQPGERIARPMHFYRVGKLDVLEFELMQDIEQVLSRYVFVRSGSYLLTFLLRSPNVDDRTFFDEFIKSIEISGQATRFDN